MVDHNVNKAMIVFIQTNNNNIGTNGVFTRYHVDTDDRAHLRASKYCRNRRQYKSNR